ncbi:UNVERIFIED_CONTAM: hypothetical protein HDU68_011710 [Siphonaria sp. JEL0065]|nr:hypothetical protein HDU68_011710 [Siphonaria sp. JEL0065]
MDNSHTNATTSETIPSPSLWIILRDRIGVLENRVLELKDTVKELKEEEELLNMQDLVPHDLTASTSNCIPNASYNQDQTYITIVERAIKEQGVMRTPFLTESTSLTPRHEESFVTPTKTPPMISKDKNSSSDEDDDNPYRMKRLLRADNERYSPYELHLRELAKKEYPNQMNASSSTSSFSSPSFIPTSLPAATVGSLPCFMFQNNVCSKGIACPFQHICLLCRESDPRDACHSLLDCPVIKKKYWKGRYCLFFQRESGWCRSKKCIHVHKCLKCDSTRHGCMQCDVEKF